jgi:ubiquinone/menaquinone biosynthesis C-methylase UbiE
MRRLPNLIPLLMLAACTALARDVPYVPTPDAVVEKMLEVAKVGPRDVVYDLGSGDGRIVITAAKKYRARGVGIDIDPQRIKEAQDNARKAGVADRVEFRQGDLFQADIKDATVVTLYLLSSVNLQLRPKLLAELKPGTRVVSHAFQMGDWKPAEVHRVDRTSVYYWVIPEKN